MSDRAVAAAIYAGASVLTVAYLAVGKTSDDNQLLMFVNQGDMALDVAQGLAEGLGSLLRLAYFNAIASIALFLWTMFGR